MFVGKMPSFSSESGAFRNCDRRALTKPTATGYHLQVVNAYEIYRSSDHAREDRWTLVAQATGDIRVLHVWRGVDCGSEEWTIEAFLDSPEPTVVKEALFDLLTVLEGPLRRPQGAPMSAIQDRVRAV